MPSPRGVLVLHLLGLLSGQVQVSSISSSRMENLPFDMAETSFDDQYDGCVAEMEEKVVELQRAEFADANYRAAWELAAQRWNTMQASVSLPEGLKPEHAIAVLAYTQRQFPLYENVNEAVWKAGESEEYYLKEFHYKSFHFLLTRALQVLQSNSTSKCRDTYHGVGSIRFVAQCSKEARFGYFAFSLLDESEATRYGDDTVFTIHTCHGASIREYSFYPEEQEVVIPPYEVFQVTDFSESGGKTRIRLTSAGVSSNYNCVYTKGAGVSHLQVNAWPLFLLWGVLLVAGALGGPGCL